MIADSLKNYEQYKGACEGLDKGLAYVATHDISSYADGKYEIDGGKVWLLLVTYDTKPYEEAFFEGHSHLTEVHMMLSGEEKVYWAPIGQMKMDPASEENVTKDKYIYRGIPTGEELLSGDRFVCFFHDDIHMTKVMANKATTIRKAVIKIQM